MRSARLPELVEILLGYTKRYSLTIVAGPGGNYADEGTIWPGMIELIDRCGNHSPKTGVPRTKTFSALCQPRL
jgi:hypothetical protein